MCTGLALHYFHFTGLIMWRIGYKVKCFAKAVKSMYEHKLIWMELNPKILGYESTPNTVQKVCVGAGSWQWCWNKETDNDNRTRKQVRTMYSTSPLPWLNHGPTIIPVGISLVPSLSTLFLACNAILEVYKLFKFFGLFGLFGLFGIFCVGCFLLNVCYNTYACMCIYM